MCSASDGRLALSGQPLLVVVPFRCARYRPPSARMTEQMIGHDRRGPVHEPTGQHCNWHTPSVDPFRLIIESNAATGRNCRRGAGSRAASVWGQPPVQFPPIAVVLLPTDPSFPDRPPCGVYVREWSARGGAGPPDLAPDDSIAGRRRGGRRSNAAAAMPALSR